MVEIPTTSAVSIPPKPIPRIPSTKTSPSQPRCFIIVPRMIGPSRGKGKREKMCRLGALGSMNTIFFILFSFGFLGFSFLVPAVQVGYLLFLFLQQVLPPLYPLPELSQLVEHDIDLLEHGLEFAGNLLRRKSLRVFLDGQESPGGGGNFLDFLERVAEKLKISRS